MDLSERIAVENARLHRITKQLSLTVSCVLTIPSLLCILAYCWPRSDAGLALVAARLTVTGLSLFALGGLLVAALLFRTYGNRHLMHQMILSEALGAARSGMSGVPRQGETVEAQDASPGNPWHAAGADACKP
ncbi:hypothetical protein [Luteibacter yeojuensis]|uniref:Uncharacterized protein n=1 Tax=Luteibacter yeojuensis TaxID=345309 RepID=A0A0F3KU97_9GAMM|nr:hypothetical protein [Luteibacter yeojuensis]KJV34731.1 hypothetical protein VI08_09025 [Luteibacter yeojuensis]